MPPDDTAAFARELRDKLPALSPHAETILRACEDPDIGATALAAMLGENPTIAARLLGLANSSFYSCGGPVYALPKAIQTLGLVTVRGISVGLIVGGQFSPARCLAFDAPRFWECAVLSAQLARELAGKVPPDRALPREAAYMTGLLHNIGLLALSSLLPEIVNPLLAVPESEPVRPLCERLREQLGFDHHQASAWLADVWRLPAPMRQAMEHHAERDYRDEGWPLAQLTGLCARRAHAIIAGAPDFARLADEEAESAAALGLDPAWIEHAVAAAQASFDTLRATAETIRS